MRRHTGVDITRWQARIDVGCHQNHVWIVFHLGVDQDGSRGIAGIGVAHVGVMKLKMTGIRERVRRRGSIAPIHRNRDVVLTRTTKITADDCLPQGVDLRSDDVEQQR